MTEIGPLPAGLSVRLETDADAAFRLLLFRLSRPLEAMLAHLPDLLRDQLMTQQFRAQTMGHTTQYPDARRYIVEQDGAPIGRVMLGGNDPLHIVDIALVPECRGRGIGGAVCRGLLKQAAARGAAVTLSVATDNPDARRLYERLGFVAVSETASDVTMRSGRATDA